MVLLTVAILVLQELARAARSAEKLLDTLNRELPTTLQDLRLTGKELSDLSEEVSGSMQSARSVAQQVDRGLIEARAQAQKARITTRSLMAGTSAALQALAKPKPNRSRRRYPPTPPKATKASTLSSPPTETHRAATHMQERSPQNASPKANSSLPVE